MGDGTEFIFLSLLKNWFIGATAGTISNTVITPIQRVKLLLDTQDFHPVIRSKHIPRYHGFFDCCNRIISQEGIKSLWNGNFANMMRYFPNQAFNFAFKDFFKRIFPNFAPETEPWKMLGTNLTCGGLAGGLSFLILYPLEFPGGFKGVAAKEWRYHHTMLKNALPMAMTFRAVYFGGYDSMKTLIYGDERNGNIVFRWMIAQFVTGLAYFVSHPFHVIRVRMAFPTHPPFRGPFDCCRKLVNTGGLACLFKGAWKNIIRGSGAGSLILVLYDQFQKLVFS